MAQSLSTQDALWDSNVRRGQEMTTPGVVLTTIPKNGKTESNRVGTPANPTPGPPDVENRCFHAKSTTPRTFATFR